MDPLPVHPGPGPLVSEFPITTVRRTVLGVGVMCVWGQSSDTDRVEVRREVPRLVRST